MSAKNLVSRFSLAGLLPAAALLGLVASAAPPMTVISTLDLTANSAKQTVKFPAGTKKVYVGVSAGTVHCDRLWLMFPDGTHSQTSVDEDIPAGRGITTAAKKGYVSAEVTCHGAPEGKLTFGIPK